MPAMTDKRGAGFRRPKVAVLMGTHNGAAHLHQQMASVAVQEDVDIELWVSDDGSSDDTLKVVSEFALSGALPVKVVEGPRRGFQRNFLSLACREEISADYFAFCDQDDVWHADKLRIAIDQLAKAPPGDPALYMSRTRTIDVNGSVVGMSPLFRRLPSLENALVQSIGGGNTMVFNQATRNLLICAGSDIDVPSHDWWTYLAATAVGGHVVYDPVAHIDYRQHAGNIVGENSSMTARVFRLRILLGGRFRRWIDSNLMALQRIELQMLPENLAKVQEFARIRQSGSMTDRVWMLRRLGLYRQTVYGTLSLAAAAVLNKL